MRTSRSLGWVAGALAIALAGSGCATRVSERHAGIAWNSAFDAALTDAGKKGRPILLDFYTDW